MSTLTWIKFGDSHIRIDLIESWESTTDHRSNPSVFVTMTSGGLHQAQMSGAQFAERLKATSSPQATIAAVFTASLENKQEDTK